MKKNALIVVTSNDKLGNTGKKTGWYLSEVSHVYYPLKDAGFTITFASPRGGYAPVEEESVKLDDELNKRFVEEFDIDDGLDTAALSGIEGSDFQVIHFAGGHGVMWDFPDNEDINRITAEIYDHGGIVAAVCHGPAALTGVRLSDGSLLIEGKDINSFTDAEEREAGKDKNVPFLLQSKLHSLGAKFSAGRNWSDKVVVDDRLITGQNPQSALSLGKAIVATAEELDWYNEAPRPREQGPDLDESAIL